MVASGNPAANWAAVDRALRFALAELRPATPVAIPTGPGVLEGTAAEAQEFLDHNEYGLAWNALFECGEREPVTPTFWARLVEAADGMQLSDRSMMAYRRVVAARLDLVAEAYAALGDVYPTDLILADPEINKRFVQQCRVLGSSDSEFDLNWTLLRARKSGTLRDRFGSAMSHIKRQRMSMAVHDRIRFASEIAARYVQQHNEGVSLDHLLCDPHLRGQFDSLAVELYPGFTPFDYRWAALRLRRERVLTADLQSAPGVHFGNTVDLPSYPLSALPNQPAVYRVFVKGTGKTLYVAQAENLAARIQAHFNSPRRSLFDTAMDPGDVLSLEYIIVENPDDRQLIERKLIYEERPLLNLQSVSHI